MKPDVQEKLYKEIKSVVDSVGSLNYETLFELKYLDAIINETLQMYASAPLIIRACTFDCTLSNGMKLQAKTFTLFSIEMIHMNEQYHQNAQIFQS